jgi:hydroxymethylglutaryl-CoA reductase
MKGSLPKEIRLRELSVEKRIEALQTNGIITPDDAGYLRGDLPLTTAYLLGEFTENMIGAFPVPLGIATNFIINGVPRLVPMATEERSVIAAASYGAKLSLPKGFIHDPMGAAEMKAQILFSGIENPDAAFAAIQASESDLDQIFRKSLPDPTHEHGGGYVGFNIRLVPTAERGTLIVIDVFVMTGSAMGANIVTRTAEAIAPYFSEIIGKRRTAVICSNAQCGKRCALSAEWPIDALGSDGAGIAERILDIHAWANNDVSRAVTHNKGVMNGITAVCLATGQDTRAIEAALAGEAWSTGTCLPLTHFSISNGVIAGSLSVTLPIGTVGGATSHPSAALCRRIMGIETHTELCATIAAVGLAQCFAALRSLADEGIVEAHRRLRAR